MRIYISGGITGVNDYMERFRKAEINLDCMGYTVFNPAKINNILPEDTLWDEYMQMSITMLGMCDAIYMLKDWQNSRGANQEYGYALGKGMKIVFEGMDEEEITNALNERSRYEKRL